MSTEVARVLGATAVMAIGTIMPAFAIGSLAVEALRSIGRNPEAASDIQTNMILAIALTEAIAIYALVVALVLIFVGV